MAQRTFGLDLLRSVAVCMVLFNHALLGFFIHFGRVAWEGKVAVVTLLMFPSIEWLFGLSGFLIGTMMIRSFETEATFWKRARSFWLRRWFRTMPTYYLFLLVNVLLVAIGVGDGVFSIKHAVFAQNLAWPERLPLFYNEAWSLALDEWFYLVMPLLVGLVALVARRDLRTMFLAATAILILTPTLARFLVQPPPDFLSWDLFVRRVTILHLDATGWGVLAAIVSRWHPRLWSWRPGVKALAGLASTALGVTMYTQLLVGGVFPERLPHLTNALSLALLGFGTFLALPWIAGLPKSVAPVRVVVETISTYSYTIYLAHLPVLYVLRAAIGPAVAASGWWLGALTVVWLGATLGVAVVIYHSFEKPVSDLRERFTRKVDANPFQAPTQPP